LAERAERRSLATKIITNGRLGLLAAFSGLVDQKYNLQDYLKPTKPKNKNDYPLFYSIPPGLHFALLLVLLLVLGSL
jgi:hypothetical protein